MEIKRSQQSLNITQVETDQRTEVSKLKPVVPNQIPDSFEDARLRKDTTSQTASSSESVKVDPKSQDLLLKQMTSARLLGSGIKTTQEKPLTAKREPVTNEQKAKLESALQNRTTAATQDRMSQPMATGGGGRLGAAEESEKGESKSKSFTIFDESIYGHQGMIEGSEDDVPEKVRDLGLYEGGTDIVSGDFNWMRFRKFQESSGDSGESYENAQLNIASVKGRIFYEGAVENGSVKAGLGAEAHAQVIAAYYESGNETRANIAGQNVNLKTEVKANVEVGAKGFLLAEASVGKDTHIHLGFAQFVGANAEVEVKETVGDYGSVRGGLGQSVGFGISGSVYAGVNDGEVTVDVDDLGAAVFYGATVDAGFSIDTAEVGSKLSDLANGATEEGFDLARTFWESQAGAAGDFAKGAAESSKGAIEDMRESVENFAQEAAETAEDVAEEAVETAEEVVEEVVENATEAAEETKDEIEDAWNSLWD